MYGVKYLLLYLERKSELTEREKGDRDCNDGMLFMGSYKSRPEANKSGGAAMTVKKTEIPKAQGDLRFPADMQIKHLMKSLKPLEIAWLTVGVSNAASGETAHPVAMLRYATDGVPNSQTQASVPETQYATDGVPNSQTQASVPETQYDADGDLQEVPVRDEEDSDDFWNNIPNYCWNYGNKKD
ncbi:hypothetical protein L1887_02633 [Cichorium endivia]|nr:hypothetical protein L1887_02633 [Cichorium endivia]